MSNWLSDDELATLAILIKQRTDLPIRVRQLTRRLCAEVQYTRRARAAHAEADRKERGIDLPKFNRLPRRRMHSRAGWRAADLHDRSAPD